MTPAQQLLAHEKRRTARRRRDRGGELMTIANYHRSRSRMIPYDTADYQLDAAQRIADELRATGEYHAVEVRHQAPGPNGAGEWVQFGRVYVDPIREEVAR